ncbi:MAG: TIGR03621 family F420-dependent LLM class oxidoreductase, partial [Actinomycetota bacterium]|nr:TIGR03621 family F420-dependent LLM class oxidoreductase [Actinomycetota bacterium]
DHVGTQLSPFAALTAAAEVTRRIRLGTFVLDNDFRHPLLMAHEAATVHLLSEGRLELGVGAGWLGRDYEALGIPFAAPRVRFERLEEAVEIVDRYSRGKTFSFSGRHYEVRDAEPLALPAELPRPPLLIGAGGPKMLALAAARADIASVFLTSLRDGSGFEAAELTPGSYRQKIAHLRTSAGGRSDEIEINVLIQSFEITDDRDGAAEKHARELGTTRDHYLALPFGLVGTVDRVVEDLLQRRDELGISYVTVFAEHLETFAAVVERLSGR